MKYAALLLSLTLFSCSDMGTARRYDRIKYNDRLSEAHHRERRIPDPANPPTSDLKLAPLLDTGRPYEREVLESVYVRGRHDLWKERSLLRIHQNGRVLYDASICGLHHRSMKRCPEAEDVRLEYPDSLERVRKSGFPNDGVYYALGDPGIDHMTWECPVCLVKSEKWRASHRSKVD